MRKTLFLFFAMLSAFCICGEYAITRPVSNALFLTTFSSQFYPYVWLFTVPLNFLGIYFYNRFLPIYGPWRLIQIFSAIIVSIHFLTFLFYDSFPQLIFFQYAWKDIYILLMLKQIWSLIHSTVKGKFLYGCIYAVGTTGAILGGLIPGFFATKWGSESIFLCTLPMYALFLTAYYLAYRHSDISANQWREEFKSQQSISFRSSPLLFAALIFVILMQTSAGLIEYQFNAHLEQEIIDKDLRTAYCGKISSLTNACSLAFQMIGGIFLIQMLGIRGSHFFLPTVLCLSALAALIYPQFWLISASYILLKALDFSIFGILREMFYMPASLNEKYRYKAIIDVFAYRTSKAFVSLSLLALQLLVGAQLLHISKFLSLSVFISWLLLISVFWRKFYFFSKTSTTFV